MNHTHAEPLTLANLATGEAASIRGLDVSPELRNRLIALGIQSGKVIKVIRRGALGGPIHVRVSTTEIVLRREEADLIRVSPVSSASRAALAA